MGLTEVLSHVRLTREDYFGRFAEATLPSSSVCCHFVLNPLVPSLECLHAAVLVSTDIWLKVREDVSPDFD